MKLILKIDFRMVLFSDLQTFLKPIPGALLLPCAPGLPATNGAEPELGSGLAKRGVPLRGALHRVTGDPVGTLAGGHSRARDWL